MPVDGLKLRQMREYISLKLMNECFKAYFAYVSENVATMRLYFCRRTLMCTSQKYYCTT